MAILKIARMGHPVLHRRASEVPDPTAPEVARLVDSMVETMEDADGTGLAAPQVHMPWRIVVYKVAPERAAAAGAGPPDEVPLTAMVNPVVEFVGEGTSVDFEACLSVPGMAGAVRRFDAVRVAYTALDGRPAVREAEGFHARVIQHECDHLDGILYPMRMEDMSLFGFVEELRRTRGDPEDGGGEADG